MTPQLMQAIKLLQLSNLDLVAYVEAELERNPLLDRGAENEPAPGQANGAHRRPADPPATARPGTAASPKAPARRRERAPPQAPLDDTSVDDAEPIRPKTDLPGGYSEWAGVGSGGRDDGDYNLESFVSAETTLADWLREQLTLAIADPARRMIGQYLIDLVDEAGYLSGDLACGGGKARHQRGRNRSRARHPADLRSARRVRARSGRMPGDPAQGAGPFRSRHAGAGCAARSFGAARISRAEKNLRRRRRGSRRHDRGNPPAQSEAGTRVRLGAGAADRAGRVCAAGARRRLARRTQLRHAAEGSGQSELLRRGLRDRAPRHGQDPTSPNACRAPPGWCARSTSAPAPS